MPVDFANTAEDYRRHRAGFPDSLFDRLAAYDVGRAGQRVVDLGASAGIGASLPVEQVTRFDHELAALLADRFPSVVLSVPHRVFAVIARPPMKGAR